MRIEARKIFWSCPEAWYLVKGDWLLAGGFPGHAHHAIDFLAHVEQIEVDFEDRDSLRKDWEAKICRGHLGKSVAPSQGVEDRIRAFWQTLQHRFPRVTNVVVSETTTRRASESLPDDLEMIVEMCPAGISASASFLKNTTDYIRQLERSLWRQVGGDTSNSGGWEMVNPMWTRHSILLPHKEFRSPVGAYQSTYYNFSRYCLQNAAQRLLLIEAIERHHFDERHEPFNCFKTECEAHFRLPGEWTLHAIDSGHDFCAAPPDEVKASFNQHKKIFEQMHERIGALRRTKEAWGEEGSERRRDAEQAFLYQLDHDPLYAHGKPAKECSTWFMYIRDLYPRFVY